MKLRVLNTTLEGYELLDTYLDMFLYRLSDEDFKVQVLKGNAYTGDNNPATICSYYANNTDSEGLDMGEEYISKDPDYSYLHAYNILKGRFLLGEKAISEDGYRSYIYAVDIIKGRFLLGEKAISEDGVYSYFYAKNVIKGRFEIGEAAIKGSSFVDNYKELTGIAL